MENLALFDLDNTLADYKGQIKKDLMKLASPDDPPVDENNLHGDHVPAWLEERMSLIKKQPGWWLNLPKLELGWDIFNICVGIGFDSGVLTKGPRSCPSAWGEKFEWCKKHDLEDVAVVIEKGRVYGRVLVDDWPPYISKWLKWRPRGLVIMPAHAYNFGYKHDNVVRCDGSNMEEVKDRLNEAFNR